MHEELFHSPERPFRATPDSRYYFPHDSIETARQTVVRAVNRAEGPVMVLGGAGLGKSLLGSLVTEDLSQRFAIVKLHAARLCSRRALLQSILFELHLPFRDLSEGDLRLSILGRLEPSSDYAPDGVLIVVDEAHTLPAKLLDELRLITNFTRGNQPRARLVLIGNLRLEHTFAEPQMESFNQRLAARCYLQPMNRQQTREFVLHQLTVAGFKPKELITDDAINSVYAASEGVPRLANQIMDHSLALAVTGHQCPVSSALVEEAWADLQQLPAPWHSGTEKGSSENVSSSNSPNTVEFGSLDDDDDWGVASEVDVESRPVGKSINQGKSDCTAPSPILPLQSALPSIAYNGSDCDEDLRLADEPLVTADVPHKNSFFAAFISPGDPSESNVGIAFDEESTELKLASEGLGLNPAEERLDALEMDALASQSEALVRPRVVFNAAEAFGASSAVGPDRSVDSSYLKTDSSTLQNFHSDDTHATLASDSFFCNRPTDEQLLAFDDEQHGYDAMGVWENDPPLPAETAHETSLEQKKTTPSQGAYQLFGDDFEEEVSLSTMDTRFPLKIQGTDCLAEKSAERDRVRDHSARQAAETADYIGRLQQFADSVATAQRSELGPTQPTVDEILADVEAETDVDLASLAQWVGPPSLDTWSIDIATLDIHQESVVQNEIEDIVSQLNFAAFSVEPFSVEQIAIEPHDQQGARSKDLSRGGKNDEIYTMHRPLEALGSEQKGFDLSRLGSDDDRDLLVIEEEFQMANLPAEESQRPVTKIAPYSQLFAKLRR